MGYISRMVTKDENIAVLPVEVGHRLTHARLDRLEALHGKWWTTGHGENPQAYATAKDACFGAVMEYLPQLIRIARKSPALNP